MITMMILTWPSQIRRHVLHLRGTQRCALQQGQCQAGTSASVLLLVFTLFALQLLLQLLLLLLLQLLLQLLLLLLLQLLLLLLLLPISHCYLFLQVDVPSFSGSFGILPAHVASLAVLKVATDLLIYFYFWSPYFCSYFSYHSNP